MDGQSFLVINGVQTMSRSCQALAAELDDLAGAGISGFRLSPQDCDVVSVASVYADRIDRRLDAEAALAALHGHDPKAAFSNGFHHGEDGARRVQRLRTV